MPGVVGPSLSLLFKKKRGKMRVRIFPRFASFLFTVNRDNTFSLLHRKNRLHGIAHTLTYRGRSAYDENLLKIGMRIQVGINRHRQMRLSRKEYRGIELLCYRASNERIRPLFATRNNGACRIRNHLRHLC